MNVLVDLASKKMGHTVQLESLTVEAAYAQMLEISTRCVGYWSQPTKIPVTCTDRDGVKRTRWVTFDFLVLETDGVLLVECKTEKEAIKLSMETPGRFARDAQGRWTSPEVEESLKEYGIKAVIVTTAELNPTLLRNYSLLEEARQRDYSHPDALTSIRTKIPAAGATLASLLDFAGEKFTKNDIYFGILRQDLHVLWDIQLLVDHRITLVFREVHHAEVHRLLHCNTKPESVAPIILKPGVRIKWNGTYYTVCNASEEKVYLRTDVGEPLPLQQQLLYSLLKSGEAEVFQAENVGQAVQHAELARLQRVLSPERIVLTKLRQQFLALLEVEPSTRPEHFSLEASLRTIQRWRKSARESQIKYNSTFWGLLDEPRPGRPRDDLPTEMRADMTQFADDLYFSKVKRTLRYVWRALRDSRRERGLRCPSHGAFRRHVDHMNNVYTATKLRDGERAAYKYSSAEIGTPNWITASDFPFKTAQMDGKLVDIGLVDEETGEYLGKPTLTLICLPHYGGIPIGWVLLFEPESYRSATSSIREMMERYGEPTKFLIVDNGKAFRNTTFDMLLAALDTTKIDRRPYDPRFGCEIESIFSTIEREFVHNLTGNTKAMRSRETATKENDPRVTAVWTFQKFHARLTEYLESLWDAPSASLGTTPRIALERDRKPAPNREGRFVLPPDQTKAAYFSDVDGGTRIVQPGRGVRVEGYYYWHAEMAKPSLERTEVRVRYDPFDLFVVLVAIDGKWVECLARHAPELRNVTEKMRRVASLVRRRLANNHAARREASHGIKLGKFGAATREDEKVLKEARRANAQRCALGKPTETPSRLVGKLPQMNFSRLKRRA